MTSPCTSEQLKLNYHRLKVILELVRNTDDLSGMHRDSLERIEVAVIQYEALLLRELRKRVVSR